MGETRVRSEERVGMPAWVGLHVQPATTLRAILDEDPRRHVTLLVAIGALSLAIVLHGLAFGASMLRTWHSFWWEPGAAGYWPGSAIGTIFTVTLVVFPLAWLSLQVIAASAWWFGRQLGGTGRFDEIRCAMAWTVAPALTLVVTAVVAITGIGAFDATWAPALGVIVAAVALVASAIIGVAFLREAHRFGLDSAVLTAGLVVAAFAALGGLTAFVVRTRLFRDVLAGGGVVPPW